MKSVAVRVSARVQRRLRLNYSDEQRLPHHPPAAKLKVNNEMKTASGGREPRGTRKPFTVVGPNNSPCNETSLETVRPGDDSNEPPRRYHSYTRGRAMTTISTKTSRVRALIGVITAAATPTGNDRAARHELNVRAHQTVAATPRHVQRAARRAHHTNYHVQ
ncbi:hypothetical protein EVAR_26646_1 [Eumeta japonica]|uniref:Uncharacterized protein n=1 Tax=Eumeta variegata TaxID=151549 RepID=A0A4C1VNW8_EUMVA|nr:hypothetical protein EVAR_26646_1 [Eumeta japonica]